MRKVRITKTPKLKKGGTGPYGFPGKGYTGNLIYPIYKPNEWAEKPPSEQTTLQPVDREDSNLEAEKGETAYLPDVDGLAAHYKIGGKPHSEGGTPLNLPDDSFIFSDTQKMKIKDPEILKYFGKTGKEKGGGFKPAELASKYDINKYRLILNDPNSDDIQRSTAEKMIGNYNLKLGKLALVQEASKGFPQGIPAIALPYLAVTGINPKDVLPLRHPDDVNQPQQQQSDNTDQAPEQGMGRYGMQVNSYRGGGNFKQKGVFNDYFDEGGTSGGQPFHAGPQDWANMGYPGMQEGGPTVHSTGNILPKSDPRMSYSESNYRVAPEFITPVETPFDPTVDYSTQYDTTSQVQSRESDQPKKGLDISKLTGDQLDSIIAASKDNSKKEYGGQHSYQDGGNILLAALAEKERRKRSQSKPSNSKPIGLYPNKSKTDLGLSLWKNDKMASTLSDNKLNEIASKTGFTPDPKSKDNINTQFQKHLMSIPEYANVIKSAHEKYGQPVGGTYDGKLGKRWSEGIENIGKNIDTKSPIGPPDYNYGVSTPDVVKKGEVQTLDNGYRIPDTKPNDIAKSKWWIQDQINTAGAVGDYMRIKKRLPWAPTVSPVIPEPTFYDPTRELSSNAEQMNIGTQGASTFSNPQQYAATFSGIQGAGAKNAADILGKYNNLNVGVANQFSGMKADILNKTNEVNANTAKTLFDETTVANDNFDRSKNMARQELRKSYVDAITNRANTQVMNTLYPNYKINPETGGMLDFYKGDKLTGAAPQDQFEQQLNYFKKIKKEEPTATWKDVFGKA